MRTRTLGVLAALLTLAACSQASEDDASGANAATEGSEEGDAVVDDDVTEDDATTGSDGSDPEDDASNADGPDGPDDATGSGSGATAPVARPEIQGCEQPTPGTSPLRRLTNAEYQNTVADLIGDAALAEAVSRNLPREPTSLGFRTNASALTVTPLIADVYTQSAQDLGRAVVTSGAAIDCEPESADAACVQAFVESFGKRVYRRPLTNNELSRYGELYEAVLAETSSPAAALEWIATAMFSSPHFLFRVELSQAPDGGVSRPTSYEMATRLSYLLWQTMPDEQLFEAAEAGELVDREGIAAQVRRMMENEKALRVYEFFEQWLDLDEVGELTRNEEVYPEYGSELRDLLTAENRAFILHLLTTNGTFAELLAADYTFANRSLAEHYDLAELPSGAQFERVEAPERAGVLTQATLIMHDRTIRSSIVKRGLKIRTDFLCQIVPAPPDDVDTTLPSLDGELTQRERLEQHRTDPSCAGCHVLMDPIGEIFEPFDALGRLREADEGGAPIVQGGTIVGTETLDGDYASASELAQAMAESDEVRECFALQAFRFFYGRDASEGDECTQRQLMESFARNDYRLVDLLMGLTHSDQFLYRVPSSEGDAQ